MSSFLIFDHTQYHIRNGLKLSEKYSLVLQGSFIEEINANDTKGFIIGDFIGDKAALLNVDAQNIKNLKGNFYFIRAKEKTITIISSVFNVLPIYHTGNFSMIGSSVDLIRLHMPAALTVDKKFILECLLFNYGFFNRTFYKEISLLPVNTLIEIQDGEVKTKLHTQLQDLFKPGIKKNDQSQVDHISDLFIETTKSYFPNEAFHIAFTGGFDGRTLVSCATAQHKKFKTFSFGRPENDDVRIPQSNAKALGLPYEAFDLGAEKYTRQYYFENALEYISHTNGGNGFIYPHFLYSTKEIARESTCLMAGYVGSELFRALHIQGAVSSAALVNLFRLDDEQAIRDQLKKSPALLCLDKTEFRKDLDELAEEIILYKKNIPGGFSKNQAMYLFVFEEVVRKFFGQWISLQKNHTRVRTPFLDYKLIVALMETGFAGANMDFLTENPYKRMKGQMIYAAIIKRTNKTIYRQLTGKGYRPVDILNRLYLPRIILPFIIKKFRKKIETENLDNLGIISGIKSQSHFIAELKNNKLFKMDLLRQHINHLTPLSPEKERDALLMTLSLVLRYEKNNSITGL